MAVSNPASGDSTSANILSTEQVRHALEGLNPHASAEVDNVHPVLVMTLLAESLIHQSMTLRQQPASLNEVGH